MDIAKRLGLSASTLNSIFAKKDIRQQIEKWGNACKKTKTGKESTFAELQTVLFTWYQEDEDDENEQEMVPSFAETYEALQKVKAFFYAQSGSNADREHI